MRSDRPRPSDPATLRRRAEAQWRARDDHPLAEAEARRLLHELQVHEIELKLQHEELEQTRQELEHSLERYAELYDFAPAGYLTLRPDGLIQQANLAAAALLGTERAQLLHQPLAGFVAAASRTPLADLLARAFRSREPETAELGLEAAGRPAVQVQMQAQVASHGRECRLVLTDITARARAQETLREAHAQLACILDGTRDAILVADVATGLILQANPEAARLLGRSRESLVGLHHTQVHPPEQAEHYRQRFRNRASEPAPAHREAEVCTAAGRRIPVEVSASTITLTDGRRALVGVFRDLTDRRRGERRERQEARRTARLLELHQRAPQLTTEALYDYVLDAAVTLTDSPEGCLHVLAQDPAVIVFTTCHRAAGETDAPMREADLWAECARRQGPVVGNDAAGSPPPHRFVTVPVIADGRVRLILGVRRKPEDYDDTDVAQLQLLANELDQLLAQRRAEEQLRLQALLLDQISDTVTATDLAGRITYVNDAQIRAFGRPREALLGQSVECFGEDPARGATQREIIETTRTRGSWQGEVVNRDASGREFIVASRTALVRDPAGQPIGLIGVGTDITERKQAERVLQASEQRFRRIVETAREGVWAMDRTHRTTFVNARMADLMGCTPDAMLGRPVEDFMFPEDLAAHGERMADRRRGEGSVYEHRFRRADGNELWTLVSATALLDDAGQFDGSFAMFTDITGRRRAEAALRESEAFNRAVLDSLFAHVAILDAAGNIVAVNEPWRAFARANGVTRLEGTVEHVNYLATLRRAASAGREDSLDRVERGIRDVLEGRAPGFVLEYPCHSPREQRWFIMRATPLTNPGGGAVITHESVTEWRRAEEALRLRDRAIDACYEGICITGSLAEDLPIVYANLGFSRLTGYPVGEVLGRNMRLLQGPDTDRKQVACIRAALVAGVPFAGEILNYRKDRTPFWNQLSITPVRAGSGPVTHFVGVLSDITERKRAQETLRETQTLLQTALDSSPIGIAIADAPSGLLRYVNPAGLRIRGGDYESVVKGVDINQYVARWQLLDLDGQPLAPDEVPLARVFRLGTNATREFIIRRAPGDDRTVVANAAPIRNDQGRMVAGIVAFLDITDHVHAQEALRESEHRFHSLFNSLAEGVAVHELVRDPDGRAVNYRLLEVNPAFESHTGISAEQARGRLATEVYRTDVAPFLDVYERVARTGEPHSFETESSPLHRSYAVSAYCPRPGWFATVFTDISERKRMEDRLRRANLELEQRVVDRTRELAQSEEHLRLAARGAGFGTFVFYFHGALAHGSPELLELYGLQAGEPLAVDADGVPRAVDPRDRDRFQAALQAASRPGSSGWFEVDARIRRPDGTVRWLRTHGRTEFGGPPDHPSPLRSMGAVTDITHRIEAEAQLRTLQSAVEQSPTVVVITDPRGNIEYVNPRFEIQTGYAAAEALGQNPRILKSGAHPPEFFEQLWRALLAGHVWRGELCNKRKDGTLFWESTAIAPIRDETGRLTHFVATKEDITERRRVAAELRQAKERADAASEAKSRFLATMSHEIRTPMNAILGFAQLMQRDGGLPAQHRQHLTTINRSGEYLLRLINDILDMSKIEAGRMQLTDADFNFHALLDDLAALFRLRTDERELGFEVAREAGVPAWLHADGGKVRQILTNVLGNAIKFTLRGGIRLRTTTEPGPGPDAVRLCVDVTDTGAGIPPEELDRVFEPFEQARTGPQQQGTGTGLGLAISRQLARMLGGDLTVASQVGVGSTFRLTFLARPGRESSPAPSGVPDARRILSLRPGRVPPRILVVDDLESNRSLLRSLLETVGYTVSEATDGVEGVARYEAERPALVLMDRRMPRLDGLEATRRIRAGPAGGSVRILILSANVLGTAEQDWRSAGADGFVGKPFDHEALLAQIGRLLGLEYIYSTPPAPAAARPGPQAVAPLPAGLREQLIKATESGDIARLRELIARQAAPSDPDLARTLGRLAETFEYEAILRLLRDPG